MAPTLAEILTAEHREIDAGIEAFLDALDEGRSDSGRLIAAIAALRRHIYIEEEFLFPPIRQAGLVMPVMVMQREHGVLWTQLDRLAENLPDPDRPPGHLVGDQCRELLRQLDAHNSKEEPVIYSHAAQQLSQSDAAAVHALLESGTTPSGWTCVALR
jgi:hemerythrin-like domain-containing protein